MNRWWRVTALMAALAMLAVACGDDDDDAADDGGTATTRGDLAGETVEVMAKWTGAELEAAEQVMAAFTEETGIEVDLQGVGDDLPTILSTRVEGGDPPDVGVLPQPGLLTDFAERGVLQPIEDIVGETVDGSYAPVWRELGSHDGTLYGLWFKASNKSLVWYNVPTFDEAGAEVPETWDELLALSGDLSDAGVTPMAVGGSVGWVLSDFFENVYVRTAGAEMYDQLAAHEIPWTDQSVKDALTTMRDMIGNPDFVARGLSGALQVGFEDSVKLVFGESPEAAMVAEGEFVVNTIREETEAEAGTDYDFFEFPSIEGSDPSVIFSGDVAVLFEDNPAAQELIRFLATPAAGEVWAALGGFLSPNQDVDLSVYPDDLAREAARILAEADVGRFDLSDQVPAALGATAGSGIWGRLQDWLSNPSDIDGITQRLEQEAQAAYGS
jgi:alpha-glucoside transport system substrate-binding protein